MKLRLLHKFRGLMKSVGNMMVIWFVRLIFIPWEIWTLKTFFVNVWWSEVEGRVPDLYGGGSCQRHLHTTASQAIPTWQAVGTPMSSSVAEGQQGCQLHNKAGLNLESRTFLRSRGSRQAVYQWAITPGPGVLAFVLKLLQFDRSICGTKHQTLLCFQSLWSLNELLHSPFASCIYFDFFLFVGISPGSDCFTLYGLERVFAIIEILTSPRVENRCVSYHLLTSILSQT